MPTLPTGVITALFTDIQGSTRLWQANPEAMQAALARHHALLQNAVESQSGYVFQIVGDSFCTAFRTASQALAAALDAQRALRDEPWPTADPLRVRMALDTGPVEARAGNYVTGEYSYGLTFSRTARLLGAGYGGQILLSGSTADLVWQELPAGVALRNLGTHRLRDIVDPLPIFQVVANDLPIDFPPLRTADRPVHNLPAPPTQFIGRTGERAEIKRLLSVARLVNLIGPGGAGKTRLSIEVARELAEEFENGVVWVTLVDINDAGLVASVIAHALELRCTEGQTPRDLLKQYLCDKELLLVLDNFEQVAPAAPLLAELLVSAPRLRILVTSREVLHLSGEHQYPVPPLGLMGGEELSPEELLSHNSAVQLFNERARAVRPSFALTEENKGSIVEITGRLDGLPLAIELAAARVKLLSPAAILKQLRESGLNLLASSMYDLPARQRTLRGAIAWSYDLLPPDEQELFRRMSVFAGGATLEAIEAVCGETNGEPLFDRVAALVDKSLIQQRERGDETRFVMLETIREFAREQLRAQGQEDTLRDSHLNYFLEQAEEGANLPQGPLQLKWYDRADRNMGNLREALEWCRMGEARALLGLRLSVALSSFWWHMHLLIEGREWLEDMLRRNPQPSLLRARALLNSAYISFMLGDLTNALSYGHKSLDLYRQLNNPTGVGSVLSELAFLMAYRGDFAQSHALLDEGIAILRESGDKAELAEALSIYGTLGTFEEASPEVVAHLEEAAALCRELNNPAGLIDILEHLGLAAHQQKDLARARALYMDAAEQTRRTDNVSARMMMAGHLAELAITEGDHVEATRQAQQTLDRSTSLRNKNFMAWMSDLLGLAALQRGDADAADAYFRDSMATYHEIGHRRALAESLAGLGGVAILNGDLNRAVRLLSASRALLDKVRGRLGPADQTVYDHSLTIIREKLNAEEFERAWAAGRAMKVEEAMEYAKRLPLS